MIEFPGGWDSAAANIAEKDCGSNEADGRKSKVQRGVGKRTRPALRRGGRGGSRTAPTRTIALLLQGYQWRLTVLGLGRRRNLRGSGIDARFLISDEAFDLFQQGGHNF